VCCEYCCKFRTFRTFDDNGSKSLDRSEFKEGLKEYGVQMSASDVDQLFSCFDKDNTGTISFDEFLVALRVSGSIYFTLIYNLSYFKYHSMLSLSANIKIFKTIVR